ncbi:5-oxoprolinase subunit PxpB [Halalkalibacter akibai]|nr:5-oxoprolinase subunit PxpB [Halalkalibacter akibai]
MEVVQLVKEYKLDDQNIKIDPVSETAVTVSFGDEINLTIHQQVQALSSYLEKNPFQGFVEAVPAFTSVTVFYEPLKIQGMFQRPSELVCSTMADIVADLKVEKLEKGREVVIPVCYGGEFGPDLEYVSSYTNLSKEEVIHIHSSEQYLVYMIGFAPGFPYLGGLPDCLFTPRRAKPRMKIPAGSVGIGGAQTGVYPISTPGGWQLIGQTPLQLFLPNQDPPSFLQAGDIIRFQPISEKEFGLLREEER